jgi:hypothetical protein
MLNKKNESSRKATVAPRKKECKLLSCKCSTTGKDYILRLDRMRTEKVWHRAYAFPFHDSLRGDSTIALSSEVITFGADTPDYNGCPYCKSKSIVFCNCGTIFCAEKIGTKVTCPGCKQTFTTHSCSTFNTDTFSH